MRQRRRVENLANWVENTMDKGEADTAREDTSEEKNPCICMYTFLQPFYYSAYIFKGASINDVRKIFGFFYPPSLSANSRNLP